MRFILIVIAAALGLSGSGQAATVSYRLDLILDQFYLEVSPVPGSTFLVPDTRVAPSDQGGTLLIDTDIHPVANSTLRVSSGGVAPVHGVSGDWMFPDIVYGTTTLDMTFDANGDVTDWSITRFGRAISGFYSPTVTQLWLGSYSILGPDTWDAAAYGEMPEGTFYYTVQDYWTASTPGKWTRLDAVAVPLPGAAVLLIAGLGCLGATRLARRRAQI